MVIDPPTVLVLIGLLAVIGSCFGFVYNMRIKVIEEIANVAKANEAHRLANEQRFGRIELDIVKHYTTLKEFKKTKKITYANQNKIKNLEKAI